MADALTSAGGEFHARRFTDFSYFSQQVLFVVCAVAVDFADDCFHFFVSLVVLFRWVYLNIVFKQKQTFSLIFLFKFLNILIFKRKKFEKKTAFSGGCVGFVLFSGSAGVKKAA